MHGFQPIEPGIDQCAAVNPANQLECGLPLAHGTHVKIATAPVADATARRHRAIDSLNRTEGAFYAIVRDETSPMARVFFAIATAGLRGATDNELYDHPDLTGMPQSTVRPRRIDLETAGLIVRATDATNDHVKRETSPGRHAQVWVLGSMARRLLLKADARSAA